jgi:predicted secreted protein
MTWTSAIVIYVILWWLIFFMTLPIGVKPPHEVGETAEEGHERGAPIRPNVWKKALATTVIAAALWGVAYWIIDSGLVSFRNA